MPSITDKLKAEEHNECTVRLWPEGSFYKAYERSAYLFVTHVRHYEVRKRYIQAAGSDVVSVGFPQSVLGKLGVTHATATDGAEVIKLSASVDEQQYLQWRDRTDAEKPEPAAATAAPVAAGTAALTVAEKAVIAKLRDFNLASATPLQCMMLLSELKSELSKGRSWE